MKRRVIVLVLVVLGLLASPSTAWAPLEGGGGPDDEPVEIQGIDPR